MKFRVIFLCTSIKVTINFNMMATVINNPPERESSGFGPGLILGIIVAILLIILVFGYGLRSVYRGGNAGNSNNPSGQVPGRVDVNVRTPGTK